MPNDTERQVESRKFLEKLSDTLMGIYNNLDQYEGFHPDDFTAEHCDAIEDELEELAREAEEVGESAKADMLNNLRLNFYALHTHGVVDNLDRFQYQAAKVMSMLEVVLLTMDSFVAKNRGKILETLQARRDRY